jgi:hypothetical protein
LELEVILLDDEIFALDPIDETDFVLDIPEKEALPLLELLFANAESTTKTDPKKNRITRQTKIFVVTLSPIYAFFQVLK